MAARKKRSDYKIMIYNYALQTKTLADNAYD